MRYLAALLFLSGLWADSTGIDLAQWRHPMLTRIHGGGLQPGQRLVADGITIAATDRETKLQGKGKSGKPWTVTLCSGCLQDIWRGDVDGNGFPDYVIAGAGPSETPAHSLSFLLMDADGLPLPFFTGISQDDPIRNLVLVDGKTRLLVSRYDQVPSVARLALYCSGHWVTQAYGFANGLVEEIRGLANGKRFPYTYNWVNTDPECAHHPIGFAGDAELWEGGTKAVAEAAPECENMTYEAVVYDRLKEREIALLNLASDTQARLGEQIRRDMATVEVRGPRKCIGTLLWARPN